MWNEATKWETTWWGNCVNTYGEQEKQLIYAQRMGLKFFHNGKSPYNIDLTEKQVIDIGGGPTSLLLKCVGFKWALVVDPINFPQWVFHRYEQVGIGVWTMPAESMPTDIRVDEVWIYNVLQHTIDPEKIIKNVQKVAGVIRIFEWIDTPTNIGHIHTLTEENLNRWLNGYGKVEQIAERNCSGKAYYGIFPTA